MYSYIIFYKFTHQISFVVGIDKDENKRESFCTLKKENECFSHVFLR